MDVNQYIDEGKKIVEISFPQQEDYKIQILDDKVIFERVRKFSEISGDLQKHLKKNISSNEIDKTIKNVRKELWGKASG